MKVTSMTARLVKLAVEDHNQKEKERIRTETTRQRTERFKASGAMALAKKHKAAREIADELRSKITALGFHTDGSVMDDKKARINVTMNVMRYETVLWQLAQADNKEGEKILSGLGIKQ